jgi:PAT family beta-lactamase induction signal transducer AmpG
MIKNKTLPSLCRKILADFAPFLSTRMLLLFNINFIGAIPYYLTGATLTVYLHELGFSFSAIGCVALLNAPHAIKFLWSHLFDSVKIPFLSNKLGLRRSWMLLCQVAIILGLIIISELSPIDDFYMFFGSIIFVNFFISSYNILTFALQMEMFSSRNWGGSEAVNVFGFRSGLLISGAGSLFLSNYMPWSGVYKIAALMIVPGVIFLCLMPLKNLIIEPSIKLTKSLTEHIWVSFIEPARQLFAVQHVYKVFMFMVFYMLYDHLLSNMHKLFHLSIGFSKGDIAVVDNVFGMFMTLLGGFMAGISIKNAGYRPVLRIGSIMSLFIGLALLLQYHMGANKYCLYATVAIQGIAHGFTMTGFLTYQMSCCSINFAVSQLSILNSFNAIGKYFFGFLAGFLVDKFGWQIFFIIISVAAIPSLFLVSILPKNDMITEK